MNIVLLEPEIPQNTGTIGRSCVLTDTTLHIIRPMGFEVTDKNLKRAGLDYWPYLDVRYYDSYEEMLEKNKYPKVYMGTTKAIKTYADVKYNNDDFIMFGKESKGIPEELLIKNKENCIRIPMLMHEHLNARSLNLSNSVSIVLYEALRQNGFNNLLKEGELHDLKW